MLKQHGHGKKQWIDSQVRQVEPVRVEGIKGRETKKKVIEIDLKSALFRKCVE